jgi:hypothetical protein
MKRFLYRPFVFLAFSLLIQSAAEASVFRTKFNSSSAYLVVEVLDDDLVHFETAQGTGPTGSEPIYLSPMVLKTDYAGLVHFSIRQRN